MADCPGLPRTEGILWTVLGTLDEVTTWDRLPWPAVASRGPVGAVQKAHSAVGAHRKVLVVCVCFHEKQGLYSSLNQDICKIER